MRQIYNISAIVLALLVGILSSGFTVYQMNCAASCPSGLYLQDPHDIKDSCNRDIEKSQQKNEEKSCCSKIEKNNKKSKEDCCDVRVLKVFKSFEYVSAYSFTIEEVVILDNFNFLDQTEFSVKSFLASYSIINRGPPDPPLPSGKSLRIRLSSLQYGDDFLS